MWVATRQKQVTILVVLAASVAAMMGAPLQVEPPAADASRSIAEYAEPGVVRSSGTPGQPIGDARRRALVVEGEADAVRVDAAPDLVPMDEFTIELWVKRLPARGCGTLIGKDRAESYWLAVCDGRLRFSFDGGSSSDGIAVLPESRWAHVAVVFDGSNLTLYVDGAPDRSVPAGGASLGRGGAPLVIGADAVAGAPFSGLIDEVRLWSIARQGRDVRDDRFRRPGVQPGLVAVWSLDGTARDLVGGHDGEVVSGGSYSHDGVLPRQVLVPLTEASIAVDGACNAVEYGGAERVVLDGPAGGTAYVVATRQDLHVCVPSLERPPNHSAYVGMFVDRDHGRLDPAQPGDYRYAVNYRGILRVDEGDGVGGYREITLPPDTWSAVRSTDRETWAAEIRVSRASLPPPARPGEPLTVGLAIGNMDVARQGDDYLWPVGAAPTLPSTWSDAALADDVGLPPAVRFSGRVRMQMDGADTEGASGAVVLLYALSGSELTLVDRMQTGGGGSYDLAYRGRAPDAFVVREIDPRGATSVSADAGPAGWAAGPNVVRYDADDNGAFPASIPDGLFVDVVGLAPTGALEQHYLIVYAPPVSEDDLLPIVEAKQRQGFRVVQASTDEIRRQADGRDLAERVHGWLGAYWEAVEPEPVYALIVGRGDAVPYRDVAWLDTDHRHPAQPDYFPAWPTTWYYADVDSEWDADGDGFFGEFMACAPGTTYTDPDSVSRDCPEAGSLGREGPYGALRSPDDDFVAEILVGRIGASSPGDVRRALEASVAAESGALSDKRRALIAGSFWWYEGESWSDEAARSVPGGDPAADPWVQRPWDGSRPFGLDAAEHLDGTLLALVQPFTSGVTRLYESTSPDGDPALVPTGRQPDAPLTASTFADRWRDGNYGIVNVEGNGDRDGVVGARWLHDWDGDGRIDQAAPPGACAGQSIDPLPQIGPPCWELYAEAFLSPEVPHPAGVPPLVFANAGETGAVAWSWDSVDERGNVAGLRQGPSAVAGLLPARGRVAAWVGAIGEVRPGALDEAQDAFNTSILETGSRVGDAVWAANSGLARSAPYDPRSFQLGLFGDPALLYWGGALDTASAWPQSGGGWSNTGATALSGPAVAQVAWQLREASGASPVAVERDGSLYAVMGTTRLVHVAPSGATIAEARLPVTLPGRHQHGPALTAGGVVLAVEGPAMLLRYDRDLALQQQVPLRSGSPVGPARVGPDGTIWVPTTGGMERIDGAGSSRVVGDERPTGGVAWTRDGTVIWPVEGPAILRFGRGRADAEIQRIAVIDGGTLSEPLVTPNGTIVVASTSGRVHAIPPEGEHWRVDTGREVRVRPVLSPSGTLVVANQAGDVVAYDIDRRSELWRHRSSEAPAGAPVVDGSLVFVPSDGLKALDLGSGAIQWHVEAVPGTGAVVGMGRSVYVSGALGISALREAGWLVGPSGVAVTPGAGRATVTWRDNDAIESGYRVEICDKGDRCRAVGTASANATTFLVAGLGVKPGVPFYARVQALADPHGLTGAASASDYAVSPISFGAAPAPAAPKGLQASVVSSEAVALSWSSSGDTGLLAGHVVRRAARGAGPYSDVGYTASDETRYIDTDLTPGVEYHYRVAALAGDGATESATVRATTKTVRLAAPTEVRALVGRGTVTVRWRDNERLEEGFVVERRGPGTATYKVIGRVERNTGGFEDRAYLADGVYHYRVKAVAEDVESPYTRVTVRYGGEPSEVYLPFTLR